MLRGASKYKLAVMITTDVLIRDFSEDNFRDWCRGKFADFVPEEKNLPAGDFSGARQLGFVRTLADGEVNRPLLVAAVQVPGELSERSSRKRQFDFARKVLQRAMDRPPGRVGGLFTQGLFAFYGDGGDFRMSLISGRVERGKLAYNSFKRQTFFVRHEEFNRTFLTQMEKGLDDYNALCEAFSIEALTQQFYNELFRWYEWATSDEMNVQYPNDIHTDKDNRELIPEHIIRLITRLMFVWFIKQKDLIPEEIFQEEELRRLLKDFDPNSKTKGNYYNAILQNLFFATLNNEIQHRAFAASGTTKAENENHYGVKTLFRNPAGGSWFKVSDAEILKLFEKVPFLNGGLFECLDLHKDEQSKRILYYDGFSREAKVKGKLTRAFVPNALFFDKERGLIPLFRRYNFTVEENSPNDAEVALDPELLGRVFENLLGVYNPETQETARKQSGSFYTPREIVSYMVDESLKQYLKTQTGVEEGVLASLFEENAKVNVSPAKRKELATAIRAVKILDPACGSGAFPMGALHRLVDLLLKLEGQSENLYDLKLHLIENCIYGVDIQPIAVQISKLRFFISLVCEQEPNNRKAANYGIRSLPNLETKFVAANTLIGLKNHLAEGLNLEDEEIAGLRKELWDVRHQHFSSKSSFEKQKLRKKDRELRKKIEKRIISIASTPNVEKIADLEAQIRKLEAEKARYAGEKWELIVEPTQGDLFADKTSNAAKRKRVDVHRAKRDELENRIRWKKNEINAEKRKQATDELLEEAQNLAAWDPYDQNKSAMFFDPQWMFGVKAGFDVVIGNPPYVRIQNLETNIAKMLKDQFVSTTGKFDLYVCFIEAGYRLLASAGCLIFINPNKFLTASYGAGIRSFIAKIKGLRILIDFGDTQNFDSATTYTCILMLQKAEIASCRYLKIEDENDFAFATADKSRWQEVPHPNTSGSWIFGNVKATQLAEKLSAFPPLRTGCDEIFQGLISGSDKLFYLELISFGRDFCRGRSLIDGEEYEIETAVCFKLLKGAEIRRYEPLRSRYMAVYPYRVDRDGQTRLLEEKTLKRDFPKCFNFFSTFRNELKARGSARMEYEHWYAYWCPRSLIKFQTPKVLTQVLASKASFTLDDTRRTLFVGGGNAGGYGIIPKSGLSLLFILGLLNSKLLDSTLQRSSSVFRGGYYSYARRFLEHLPLCRPSKNEQREIEVLVDEILATKRTNVGADVSFLEREIDERVYRLYGLSSDEIALIEAASTSPKKVAEGVTPSRAGRGKRTSVLVEDEGLD